MKRELIRPRVQTPWGVSQQGWEYGDGVHCYSTAGHGGFRVSAERLAEMPAGLRAFAPYAGEGWYEEDCDWCVVALAFPALFEPHDVWAAVKTARHLTGPYGLEVREWLLSPEGMSLRDIADQYERLNAAKFHVTSEGTSGRGWFVSARTMNGARECRFWFPSVPTLPTPFSFMQAIEAGGVEQPEMHPGLVPA